MLQEHDFVDFGIEGMPLWATCNLGASSPEQRGDRYAWGETQTKNKFKASNYEKKGKYNKRDGKTQLELEDDAARAQWGGKWQMPTADDFDLLSKKCKLEKATVNGKSGLLVSHNGKSIFLPDLPIEFAYWTASPLAGSEDEAISAKAYGDYIRLSGGLEMRYSGYFIRPIMRKCDLEESEKPQPAAQKEEPKKADAKKEASSTNLMIENMATEFENELGTFYPKNDWSDLELIKGAEGLLSDDYEGTFSGQVDYALVDQDEETETDDSAYNLSRAIKNIYMNLDDPDEWPLDSKSMRYNAGNTTKGIWVFGTDKYGSMDDGTVLVLTNEKGAFAILKVENVEAIGDWCF